MKRGECADFRRKSAVCHHIAHRSLPRYIFFEMSEILIPVVYSSLHAPTGILYYTSII